MTAVDGRLPLVGSLSTDTLAALILHSRSDDIVTRATAEKARRVAALRWVDTEGVCARRRRDLRDEMDRWAMRGAT